LIVGEPGARLEARLPLTKGGKRLKIKGNNLLVKTDGAQPVIDFTDINQHATIPNQGVILGIGDKVDDPDYKLGDTVIYSHMSATQISDSKDVIVGVEGVLAIV